MRVVWKYQLFPGVNIIPLPVESKIVAVGPWEPNADGPAVWVERTPEDMPQGAPLRLEVVGTGLYFQEGGRHIGSAWCGPFMWHIYEVPA